MKLSRSGFTIVELAIVIIIIAVLATLTVASYGSVRKDARDAKRKSDLSSIAEAIQLYRHKYGDDVKRAMVNTNALATPPATGFARVEAQCGNNGAGWINYSVGSFDNPSGTNVAYQSSILKCLVDNGYLDKTFIEPFNCTTNAKSNAGAPDTTKPCEKSGYAYMKYSFGNGDTSYTCLYAKLEAEDHSAEMLSASSPCQNSAGAVNTYKMNYMLRVD